MQRRSESDQAMMSWHYNYRLTEILLVVFWAVSLAAASRLNASHRSSDNVVTTAAKIGRRKLHVGAHDPMKPTDSFFPKGTKVPVVAEVQWGPTAAPLSVPPPVGPGKPIEYVPTTATTSPNTSVAKGINAIPVKEGAMATLIPTPTLPTSSPIVIAPSVHNKGKKEKATPVVPPSDQPSAVPLDTPSTFPSYVPSTTPSIGKKGKMPRKTIVPSDSPSNVPSDVPCSTPTAAPVFVGDKGKPTVAPSDSPAPSNEPSLVQSDAPSNTPSVARVIIKEKNEKTKTFKTVAPSHNPTSSIPSLVSAAAPAMKPNVSAPAAAPTFAPPSGLAKGNTKGKMTVVPSDTPSSVPSDTPTSTLSTVVPNPALNPKRKKGQIIENAVDKIFLKLVGKRKFKIGK